MDIEYINLFSTDPYYNLACEQFVFDQLPRDKTYVMLWQNDRTIVIGRYQNAYAEINTEYVTAHNIKIARRLSGGGAVYHDMGNLNYTYITDSGDLDRLNLKLFCQPVLKALKNIGVEAELNGRNDITISGRKFSGNSQYMRNGRVLHHGTILFDSDLSVLDKALRVDDGKIASKGIKSVLSRVTNVSEHLERADINITQFREIMLSELIGEANAAQHIFSSEETNKIILLREKYSSWEWNFGQSPECTIFKERRFSGCGKIEMYVSIKNGIVSNIEFKGDFFSQDAPSELAEKLCGEPRIRFEVIEKMEHNQLHRYFSGIDKSDFISFIKEIC